MSRSSITVQVEQQMLNSLSAEYKTYYNNLYSTTSNPFVKSLTLNTKDEWVDHIVDIMNKGRFVIITKNIDKKQTDEIIHTSKLHATDIMKYLIHLLAMIVGKDEALKIHELAYNKYKALPQRVHSALPREETMEKIKAFNTAVSKK